ncbi:MAG: hypothetical protein ACR65U_14555 [Methylocystis sp.]
MRSIPYELDEFTPFRAPNGDEICVYVYGEAEIEYDDADWWVSAIALDAGRLQPAPSEPDGPQKNLWVESSAAIDRSHPLWAPISNALVEYRSEQIDALVAVARNGEQDAEAEANWKSARTDAAFADAQQ